MEAQTLIVEEDGSLGSTDDQNVNDLSATEGLLDTGGEDDVDLQYQFRSNEGGKLISFLFSFFVACDKLT